MPENETMNGWTFEETIKTAENLMEAENNVFKWDVLRHLRDFAEHYKEQLEQYRAIGTVEECRVAVEKMKPKKGIPYTSSNNHKFVECPSCHKDMDLYYDFCQYCGQAVDWGKSKT